MKDYRARILEAAESLIGSYGKGSDEVYDIWRDVCDPKWTDAQVRQYLQKEWCGGSALHALHLAGVGLGVHWIDGVGFIGPAKLRRLDKDEYPKSGDLAVKNLPYAHHMIVCHFNHPLDWSDLAGNTPHYARHRHVGREGIDFYDVSSLFPPAADTVPAPPPESDT